MSYTDSVIYELHVRDFSIDESSGIQNKGKFLGLTEKGTKNPTGQTTGLDYLTDLGVTHIHLLPSYDYGSVDETKLDTPQYNWGYDPKNYNVPEGSYSTDPYNGAVRVKEMKQMVKTLHDNNINVIMDVVYNHVYETENFCFNQIVPKYFSERMQTAAIRTVQAAAMTRHPSVPWFGSISLIPLSTGRMSIILTDSVLTSWDFLTPLQSMRL